MPPKTTAFDDIFGGGDDSDLSDVEEPQAQGALPSSEGDEGSDQGDEDDDEPPEPPEPEDEDEDDAAGDADYRQTEKLGADGLPRFKKDPSKKRASGDGEERPKKRTKKKSRQQDGDDGELTPPPVYDPVAERNARLDSILQPKKKKAPRKRKAGEEDLDELADEEVYRLRQLMDSAAENDREAVSDGRPAIEKLKLLPEVVAVLQKPHLETTILEADILTQMRRWLEPIGKAMPALNIQRALLEALLKLDIETSQLKAAELGKVVLFYTKHPKLDPSIKRLADQLVMAWMRPIIRRSAQARDRAIQRAEAAEPARRPRTQIPSGSASRDKTQIAKRHAAIPQALTTAYKVAPISRVEPIAGVQKSNSRFKSIKSKLEASKSEHRKL